MTAGRPGLRAPWRLPPIQPRYPRVTAPRGRPLVDPAPAGLAGEFDSLVDPAHPRFSSANLSEAFPGPMTALSLDVSHDCLGSNAAGMVDFLGIRDPELAHVQSRFAVAVFGHRFYTSVSAIRLMAEAMPGADPDEMEAQFLGTRPATDVSSAAMSLADVPQLLGLLARVGPRIAGLPAEIRRSERRAAAVPRDPQDVARLDDDHLAAAARGLHDLLAESWWASVTTNLAAAGTQNAAMKLFDDVDEACFVGGLDDIASAGVLRGVEACASVARGDPTARQAIVELAPHEFLAAMRRWPELAARFDQLVEAYGHRGRGETELANLSFRDDPAQLVAAIAAATGQPSRARPVPPVPAGAVARRMVRSANTWLRRRERARDAVVRVTHALRLVAREHGTRMARAGRGDDPSDVFHLTLDEMLSGAHHHELVQRRRTERERLAALRLPGVFEGRWEPISAQAEQTPGPVRLEGLGASPGRAVGPARVLTDPADRLRTGEVLVAHVTDVGWTSLFAGAAAVVTDVGGVLSHAAVVAREYGIPCVVSTQDATTRLRTGQVVEVDGAAGTVHERGPGAS